MYVYLELKDMAGTLLYIFYYCQQIQKSTNCQQIK